MRISPIKTNKISFNKNTEDTNNKHNKNNKIIITSGAVLVGGALAFIYYNKPSAKNSINITHSNSKTPLNNKDKFLELCRQSKRKHYIASTENINNKIFKSDLHSHSNHSDGWGKVTDILEQANQYAEKLYNKTGEKFNFSITDHDRVSGV